MNNAIYPIRKVGTYPQIYVQQKDKKYLGIRVFRAKDISGYEVTITKKDARLLARRILSCLNTH